MKTRVWLSYDLSVKGDYENLYTWLDAHKAQECGDSIATFFWESDTDTIENIKTEISSSLKTEITFSKKDRVYLVFKKENETYAGSFIIGSRKANPWEGYSQELISDDEEFAF